MKYLVIILILINGISLSQEKTNTNDNPGFQITDNESDITEKNDFGLNELNVYALYAKVISRSTTGTLHVNFSLSGKDRADISNTDLSAAFSKVPQKYIYSNSNFAVLNSDNSIRYSVKYPGIVKLKIFSSEGEEISTLVDEFQGTGEYEVHFDGFNSGHSQTAGRTYYYSIEINRFASTNHCF